MYRIKHAKKRGTTLTTGGAKVSTNKEFLTGALRRLWEKLRSVNVNDFFEDYSTCFLSFSEKKKILFSLDANISVTLPAGWASIPNITAVYRGEHCEYFSAF